ncbi:MAG: two-component sensor histidine kinase [Burkholderiales bacterium]|nr:two-component sensor histidine kinase [Burkholderiales bacterium]MDE1929076.1 two-component sensor histidine kinase [Burkholderiales bacterium]MDE2505414.1 two-component sensor histidine kinase [Burkholderiales bacterium]
MDGLQRRLNESVRLKLSLTLALTIVVVAALAGAFSFMSALDEAHELQDDMLRQVAQLVYRQGLAASLAPADQRLDDGDEESLVIVQRLGEGAAGAAGVDAGGPLPLPTTLADGLQMVRVEQETFRVLVGTARNGARYAVAQEAAFRDQIARASALRTLLPFLVLVPVLLLLVADLVRKMFRPISALSGEIDRRAEQDLRPVDERHLPIEVRPFAVAINRLLARVSQAMDAQRRFVADAAHELRSPLTALSLQAERLAQAPMSEPARERLLVLRQGIVRGRNLLDQLLGLTRAQSAAEKPRNPLSVQEVYRRALEDLMPLAEAKRIDVGVEGTQDARLWVSEIDLMAIVKNLLDNAIRYTPAGGRVDLSVGANADGAWLRIRDTGPGIPAAERARVFDPFYRLLGSDELGSGLGLSIVQAIAQRIGARIRLADADALRQRGLSVELHLPPACVQRPEPGADARPAP